MKPRRIVSILSFPFLAAIIGVANFSHKEAVRTVKVEAADYYASITDSMEGSTLLSELKKIINTSSVSVSYDWSRYEQADEDQSNKSNVRLIYSRISMPKSQKDRGANEYCWNREHTFPQSKISADKAKNDNHIIFASEKTVNGKRGSIPMGVVTTGTVVKDFNGNATTCLIGGGHFDPHNVSRGIVARSTMYAAAMYGFDPLDNFESFKTLLEWHFEYQPDEDDMRRNEVVYKNQKNRNPFVDHPEYACRIWGKKNTDTQQICSSYSKGVTMSKTSVQFEVNSTTTISAKSSNSSTITWTNSNPNVVSLSASTSSSSQDITLSALAVGTATLTATATVDGEEYSATCSVTVKEKAKLSSITLSGTHPTKFKVNDSFTYSGLIVTAKYTSGASKQVTGYTVSSPDMSVIGDQNVIVSYTEESITKQATYKINIYKPDTPKSSGGCGGNIVTTSVILSSLSILGIGLLLIKRKFIK